MHTRILMIGAAALSIAAMAAAEPAKPDPKAAESPSRPAELVLASADQVRTPPAVEQAREVAAAPPKKRAARVTSCRCAGQNER